VPVTYHNTGPPSHQCHNCHAIMWYKEREKSKTAVNPTFSLCCQGGKVLLPIFKGTPPPLNNLLNYNHPATSKFRDQIRVYNGMFYFTSFGAKIDHLINTGRAPYTFRINGQNYHRMGSLLPKEGIQPKFTQLYFFDTRNEVKNRTGAFIDKDTAEPVDEQIVQSLIQMLDEYSSDAKAFRMARDWCNTHNTIDFHLRLHIVNVIEFQKRGLPHAHILLWIEEHSKCRTPSEIDDIIYVELPSPTDDPAGYKVVTEYMLHGPCGKDIRYAACTNDGKYSKHFPKPFLAETFLDEEGYPHYRRRDNKVTIKKEISHTITSM
ncbi:hypothetical protein Tco_0776983, partial [Tanacetum coccineum]